jgi:hypothetical protein
MGLGALRERGSGGSGAGPVGLGAWGEADRERAGAWSFEQRQGAQKAGQERGSGGPERGSGMLRQPWQRLFRVFAPEKKRTFHQRHSDIA